jgi:hypothetical protein
MDETQQYIRPDATDSGIRIQLEWDTDDGNWIMRFTGGENLPSVQSLLIQDKNAWIGDVITAAEEKLAALVGPGSLRPLIRRCTSTCVAGLLPCSRELSSSCWLTLRKPPPSVNTV